MALEFIDSCSHSGTGSGALPVYAKYTTSANNGYITTPNRRAGQDVLQIQSGVGKTLSYQSERTVGLAYYYPTTATDATPLTFFSGGTNLVWFMIESDNSISIYTNSLRIFNSGSLHLIITSGVYHYYEFQVTLSGSSPISVTCSLSVDEQPWATAVSGITGTNASDLFINAAQMNGFTIGGVNGGGFTSEACDIYCLNPSTTDINGNATTLVSMLGDVAIDAVVADADVTTAWSNFGGSPPPVYPLISQIPSLGDTEYIYSDTVTQEDTFNFQPLVGFTGTILGAQLLIYARKDAEGSRTIQGLVGGVPQISLFGTQDFLYDYYDYHIWPLDSDNGVPWTPTIYNAEAFGVNLSA